jgi:SAM-dependent methyltransferase
MGFSNFCLICEKESEFTSFGGHPGRLRAKCPNCESLERDRFSWLYFSKYLNLKYGLTFLDIGIDVFANKLKEILKEGFVTAGIEQGVDHYMDLCNLTFFNEAFDVVYCSHVLEHIVDDRKAMREIARVLKRNGEAIILVPTAGSEVTLENLDIGLSGDQRMEHFGHPEHWRAYGQDFVSRMETSSGLVGKEIILKDFPQTDWERFGITERTGTLFVFTRDNHDRA